jgi:D-serine dehydratase
MMARDAKRQKLTENSLHSLRHKASTKSRMIDTLPWIFVLSPCIDGGDPGVVEVELKVV